MAYIENDLGNINSGGSSMGQNNIDIIKIIRFTSTNQSERYFVSNFVNNLPTFELSEIQSLWVKLIPDLTVIENNPVYITNKYKILNKGKGTYGISGDNQLTEVDCELVYTSQLVINDIINLESTDIISITSLGGQTISQYVNSHTPPYVIQSQSEGYTIFQIGTDPNNLISYLYLGEGGTFGQGSGQTIDSDFQLLNNNTELPAEQGLQEVTDVGTTSIYNESGLISGVALNTIGSEGRESVFLYNDGDRRSNVDIRKSTVLLRNAFESAGKSSEVSLENGELAFNVIGSNLGENYLYQTRFPIPTENVFINFPNKPQGDYTLATLDDIPTGGNFIPLTGTESGSPITGKLLGSAEFDKLGDRKAFAQLSDVIDAIANQDLQSVLDNGNNSTTPINLNGVPILFNDNTNTNQGGILADNSGFYVFGNAFSGTLSGGTFGITPTNTYINSNTKLELSSNNGVTINTAYPLDNTVTKGIARNASNRLVEFDIPTASSTNLTYTASSTNGIVNSDTGTDATIPLADATNAGLLSPSEKTSIGTIVSKMTNPMTSAGDLIYGGSGGTPTRLANTANTAWPLLSGGGTNAPYYGQINLQVGSVITGIGPVSNGFTGRNTGGTANSLVATGTTATGAQQTIANSTSGFSLFSNGTSLPSFRQIVQGDVSGLITSLNSKANLAGGNNFTGSQMMDGDVSSTGEINSQNSGLDNRINIQTTGVNPNIQGANFANNAGKSISLNRFGGNVGIGLFSPTEALEVAGNGKFSGTGLFGGLVSGIAAVNPNNFVIKSQLDAVATATKTGSNTQSGNGTSTAFNIPHGLGTTPTYWNVVATSAGAGNISYITANATNIIVNYSIAPSTGTNNLSWNWIAR